MKVIAIRQLHSAEYGTLAPNEVADLPYGIAQDLLKRKLVRLPHVVPSEEAVSPSATAGKKPK